MRLTFTALIVSLGIAGFGASAQAAPASSASPFSAMASGNAVQAQYYVSPRRRAVRRAIRAERRAIRAERRAIRADRRAVRRGFYR